MSVSLTRAASTSMQTRGENPIWKQLIEKYQYYEGTNPFYREDQQSLLISDQKALANIPLDSLHTLLPYAVRWDFQQLIEILIETPSFQKMSKEHFEKVLKMASGKSLLPIMKTKHLQKTVSSAQFVSAFISLVKDLHELMPIDDPILAGVLQLIQSQPFQLLSPQDLGHILKETCRSPYGAPRSKIYFDCFMKTPRARWIPAELLGEILESISFTAWSAHSFCIQEHRERYKAACLSLTEALLACEPLGEISPDVVNRIFNNATKELDMLQLLSKSILVQKSNPMVYLKDAAQLHLGKGVISTILSIISENPLFSERITPVQWGEILITATTPPHVWCNTYKASISEQGKLGLEGTLEALLSSDFAEKIPSEMIQTSLMLLADFGDGIHPVFGKVLNHPKIQISGEILGKVLCSVVKNVKYFEDQPACVSFIMSHPSALNIPPEDLALVVKGACLKSSREMIKAHPHFPSPCCTLL